MYEIEETRSVVDMAFLYIRKSYMIAVLARFTREVRMKAACVKKIFFVSNMI